MSGEAGRHRGPGVGGGGPGVSRGCLCGRDGRREHPKRAEWFALRRLILATIDGRERIYGVPRKEKVAVTQVMTKGNLNGGSR